MPRLALRPLLACLAFSAPAAAQEAAPQAAGAIALTLDGLAQVEGACRLTFVARNGLAADVDPLVIEAVAFGPEGGVARIATFDFGALPAGRTRVRLFDLVETGCDAVGSVLINGTERCDGPAACPLTATSRAEGVGIMR